MPWKIVSLLACALLIGAAAPARKPAATPAPAVASAPTRAPASTRFNATDPASVIGLLEAMGARSQIAASTPEEVDLTVTTPGYGFSAQFAGCVAKRACKALAFTTQATAATPTLPQINGFNQTSIGCKAWQDRAGKPHVMYSTLVFAEDSVGQMQLHVGAWQGCLANFGEFVADPLGYLALAP